MLMTNSAQRAHSEPNMFAPLLGSILHNKGTYNTATSLNCDGGPCLTRHAGFGRLRVQGSSEVLR